MKKHTKTLLALAATLLLVAACQSFPPKGNWGVETTVEGSKTGDTLRFHYLKASAGQNILADTLILLTEENQKVRLAAPFVEASAIGVEYASRDALVEPFYIELFVNRAGECIRLSTQANDYTHIQTTGGMYDQPDYDSIRILMDDFYTLRTEYIQALQVSDTLALMDLSKRMGELQQDYLKASQNYIKNNPSQGFSAYLLLGLQSVLPADSIRALFETLDPQVRNTTYGRNLSEQQSALQASQNIREGAQAPDFTATDLEGKTFSLSDYRGQWVLVDFLGSWCGPCRQGNPSLVKLYAQYKGKGFEIIGLAVNDKEENLRAAIAKDGITWRNVDLSQDKNNPTLPTLYNLQGVPTKLLIDPEGHIEMIEIGYDPNDDPLPSRLKEIFR